MTLTPPPANAMLAAQASDEGWTLSDGKLTVTGEVYSEYFSYWNDVQSIEVTGGFFALSDGMSFSGTITVLESGTFYNYGNVSGTISVESSCYFMNNGTISGGMVSGPVYNHGTISGGTFTGLVDNSATISGGIFSGEVDNYGNITAGNFSKATVDNFGTINGGTFNDYTISNTSGVRTLTITAPIEVTDDMLVVISTVNVTATGEITGGTLRRCLDERGDRRRPRRDQRRYVLEQNERAQPKSDHRRHVQWYRMELRDHQRRHIQRVHRESRRGVRHLRQECRRPQDRLRDRLL